MIEQAKPEQAAAYRIKFHKIILASAERYITADYQATKTREKKFCTIPVEAF